MPDKPLTVFTYAASASLAAVALVYFFHPSYLFDGDTSQSSNARKKGIVGLQNPANDCFINCVLQSLAGLGDLRVFLIREIHRRELVSSEIYDTVPLHDLNGKLLNEQKMQGLQNGLVTKGLKDMIDRLNEKPIYRKTISANAFIRVLEHAFGSTISKSQQDAQEFLQLVAERLSEEYHAGTKARRRFADLAEKDQSNLPKEERDDVESQDEDGFSLEGKTETRVECEHCHFIPKAKPTSFVMLNLMVPQRASSTLNDCFDAHFKREFIDDYKCDKCRLVHALELYRAQKGNARSEAERTRLQSFITMIEEALEDDPETLPDKLILPDIKHAPKRKISRHVEITKFPRVLVIHLSRSIYDRYSYSMKNSARVTFPERFPLGGILRRRQYKLLGVITHKGTHNSGHYETFRRQHVYAPYSNPHANQDTGPYSTRSSLAPTPNSNPNEQPPLDTTAGQGSVSLAVPSGGDSESQTSPRTSGTHSLPSTPPSTAPEDAQVHHDNPKTAPVPTYVSKAAPVDKNATATDQYLSVPAENSPRAKDAAGREPSARLKRRKKPPVDRWWRISDDKIKECKTAEVLGMVREVYMLFYEME